MSLAKERKLRLANRIFQNLPLESFKQDEGDVVSIERHMITETNCQLRVKTKTDGTHYYTLKLSEGY